jgi:hypothetical protein
MVLFKFYPFFLLCFFLITLSVTALFSSAAWPRTLSVSEDVMNPLWQNRWEALELPKEGESRSIGKFFLPMNQNHPNVISPGTLEVIISRDRLAGRESYWLDYVLALEDPYPLGLAYTYQKVQLTWESSEGSFRQAISIDWSRECQSPGISLFNGQRYSGRVPVSFLTASDDMPVLQEFKVEFWGGRPAIGCPK